MKREITVTINDLSEQDLRNIFHDVFRELDVRDGSIIPSDMVNVRETLITILFNKKLD